MKNIFLSLALILIGSAAVAEKVGSAGCGLGNMVFHTDNQVLASTTNDTSGNQTFGITSGTSNCVDSSRTAQLENYVEVNRVALASDMSRGQGETLAAVATILGCKDQKAVSTSLKNNYQTIFPTENVRAGYVTRQIERSTAASCHLG